MANMHGRILILTRNYLNQNINESPGPVIQLVGACPVHWRVAGSIPLLVFLSHIDSLFFPSSPLFSSSLFSYPLPTSLAFPSLSLSVSPSHSSSLDLCLKINKAYSWVRIKKSMRNQFYIIKLGKNIKICLMLARLYWDRNFSYIIN